MATKIPTSIPKTATHAKKAGYKPTAKIKHADLSDAQKNNGRW